MELKQSGQLQKIYDGREEFYSLAKKYVGKEDF